MSESITLASVTMTLLGGFGTTVELFVLTLLFALPLGLLLSFGAMSRFAPLRGIVKTVVWIIRGTPLMLQIIVIFFGPGLLWDGDLLPRFTAALVAFVINYACYFSEIFRGGIQSIPRGQQEAGLVLCMTRSQIFFKVTLLQVIKRIVPPMGNEFITLVKDTSLAQAIGVVELLRITENWVSSAVDMTPFLIAGIFYLVMNGIVTRCFTVAEKRLSYYR